MNRESFLVIRNGTLRPAMLARRRRRDRDPPRDLGRLTMVASGSKCRVCRQPAIIDLPRHNANFCAEHLLQLCRRQVEKAIADHDMLTPRRPRSWSPSAAARTRSPCGTSCSSSATPPTGCTSGWGSATTATRAATTRSDFADERGLTLRTIDLRARVRIRRAHRRQGRPGVCRARRAASRSGTCSTRRRAKAGTTSS